MKGIVQEIYHSDLVIADLTGQKPNVYYELGIRHSLSLGTIIITQDMKALPSDLASYYCFEYTYSQQAYEYSRLYNEFSMKLHEKIDYILENKFQPDSPVSDFLELNHYFTLRNFEDQKKKFGIALNNLINLMVSFNTNFENVVEKKDILLSQPGVPVTIRSVIYSRSNDYY